MGNSELDELRKDGWSWRESGGQEYKLKNFAYFCYNGARVNDLANIDTSEGTDFSYMFNGMPVSGSLTGLYMPDSLDTKNGKDFSYMFKSQYITKIPMIDTSNGRIFTNMFNTARMATVPRLDISNAQKCISMFASCENLVSVPELNFQSGPTCTSMFVGCTALQSVSMKNFGEVQAASTMFSGCSALTTVGDMNMNSLTAGGANRTFMNCTNLTNIRLYNIRVALTIGSGTAYGHLLTIDSLVHTIKELCKVDTTTKLTMGSANLEKVANLYCRVLDDTTEKIEMELCESTDEGAITLEEYAGMKNWTFA